LITGGFKTRSCHAIRPPHAGFETIPADVGEAAFMVHGRCFMRLRFGVGIAVVALLMGSVGLARAQGQTISQIVVLGDSLSDNGNLFAVAGLPAYPYWEGRVSNGPVAVEYVAQSLGILLKDFAWAGATTGVGNYLDGGTVDTFGGYSLPGMTTAFQSAFSAGLFPIDPNALYVVWGGPNDFWDVTDEASAYVAVQKAVTNLVALVGQLQALGAKQILVLNMPDLGKAPSILDNGPVSSYFFTQVSMGFNEELKAHLPPGVRYFDTFAWMWNLLANPAAYGFTNVTDACFTGFSICANPNEYLFWDDKHPTTAGHAVLADALLGGLAQTVVIGECDSGVPDVLAGGGFTISELIAQAAAGARNHGAFVSGVASITNGLVQSGLISGRQKGAIQGCAAGRGR
jgi:phospholipase/lecithinase/hemolysin